MRRYAQGTNIADFNSVRLAIASPEDILEWSYGEVTKPETINYRTQKPERDGLFCERIFGPVKDINPHDAKYKGLRSREAAVDKNGEIVTKSIVRRERMGHISLASPVAHIWFLRGTPSAVGLVLNMTVKNLERVVYFASYIIKKVDAVRRDQLLSDKEAEYAAAQAAIKARYEKDAAEENANLKAIAEMQTKELEEVANDFETIKSQAQSIEKYALLSEGDYRNLPDELRELIEVGMGGTAIRDLLEEINLEQLIEDLAKEAEETKGQRKKKIMKRLRMLESMHRAGIKPSSMCVSVLPVIPPDLRPMVQLTGGRFATSDLNDLYRRVINRNNRLKKLIELNAPEVIRRNEQRMLQEAVDALIDNNSARSGRAVASTGQRRRLKSLSDLLKGKQGRFRQNLLGKRVDYSGRSVIVAGPELKINQCGLPKMMALELFKPFVIGYLIQHEQAHNIRSATRMIEVGEPVVWDALDAVIEGKYVLLNRAPSLHRLSVLAFQPKLIEGKAIQLHPLVCKGFNADFDGDQMAVHLPLSDQAQHEAATIMAAPRNLLKPADGKPVLNISQDMVLGLYYLTYEKPSKQKEPVAYSSVNEAIFAFDQGALALQSPIMVSFRGQTLTTTLGRIFFNEILPENFTYQNVSLSKKQMDKIMSLIFEQYGEEVTARVADEVKDLGFSYATVSGLSTGMDDYVDLDELDPVIEEGQNKSAEIYSQYEQGFITNEERYKLTVETWRNVDNKVLELLNAKLNSQDTGVSLAAISGARGSINQIKQVTGMIGVIVDTLGREIELPIRSNYKFGLTPLEYFTSTRGSRKGLIDTALKTADSGYLTRRLVDVVQDVFTTDEDIEDPGFTIYREESEELNVGIGDHVAGRVLAKDVKIDKKTTMKAGEIVTKDVAELLNKSEIPSITIKSILSTTNLRGVSQEAYGIDLATGKLVAPFTPVGVIAAQSIGELGTQLTLDTKHKAGAATEEDVTRGLPRVDELFEARTPKGQAYLTDIDGTVSVWEEGDHYVVQISANKQQDLVLPLEGRVAQVKTGQSVVIGDVIASKDEGRDPLIASMAGTVEIHDNQLTITPEGAAVVRYEIPTFRQLIVKDGSAVVAGDRLTNGSINLQELLRLKGVESTQRYIMNEVMRIFAIQGENISAKHVEIVVRQMFSRVQIEDSGDSEFVTGDIVSRAAVVESNQRSAADGKEPAIYNQLLLGITKVSTWADSFLSAASFQDTTRVLISAATSGKIDPLYGLKENVIIGRKIPVGTGARRMTGTGVTDETAGNAADKADVRPEAEDAVASEA